MTMNTRALPAACSSSEVAPGLPTHTRAAWSRAEVRRRAELGPVLDAVAAALTTAGYLAEDVLAVSVALEQAVVNSITHGHGGDPSKAVRLAWRFADRGLLARVEDDGPGFDPALLPDPLDPFTGQRRSGRGLQLIAACMTAVSYCRQRRRLTLWKRRTTSPDQQRWLLPCGA
jgi:serine/threonine-protein kinase RsbW